MQTYISILRGINLGGHHSIKMEDLKQLLGTIGLKNAQTYIQSGNIVFQYKKSSPEKLSQLISAKIMEAYNFDVL